MTTPVPASTSRRHEIPGVLARYDVEAGEWRSVPPTKRSVRDTLLLYVPLGSHLKAGEGIVGVLQ
jgi:hypothetical protein